MSTRNDILEDFKTCLNYIQVGNGFNFNVKKVVRKFLHWSDVNTYPILMVLGGDEDYEDDFGDQTLAIMIMKIKGYSKDKSEPEIALNELMADVRKCLENETYNPHKAKMKIERTLTDEGWLSLDTEGLGMFEMQLRVYYKFVRSNP